MMLLNNKGLSYCIFLCLYKKKNIKHEKSYWEVIRRKSGGTKLRKTWKGKKKGKLLHDLFCLPENRIKKLFEGAFERWSE